MKSYIPSSLLLLVGQSAQIVAACLWLNILALRLCHAWTSSSNIISVWFIDEEWRIERVYRWNSTENKSVELQILYRKDTKAQRKRSSIA